jgi:hypothetical protein
LLGRILSIIFISSSVYILPTFNILNILNLVIIKWKYKNVYLYLLSNKTAMISRNLDHQKKTYTHALFLRVSE